MKSFSRTLFRGNPFAKRASKPSDDDDLSNMNPLLPGYVNCSLCHLPETEPRIPSPCSQATTPLPLQHGGHGEIGLQMNSRSNNPVQQPLDGDGYTSDGDAESMVAFFSNHFGSTDNLIANNTPDDSQIEHNKEENITQASLSSDPTYHELAFEELQRRKQHESATPLQGSSSRSSLDLLTSLDGVDSGNLLVDPLEPTLGKVITTLNIVY
jgi:hypothetical protein